MIPNMSNVVRIYQQPVVMITITRKTVDFIPVITRTPRDMMATVQPADMDKLNPDIIDWGLEYLMVHSVSPFNKGEVLFYHNKYYKIIDKKDYSDYGYTTGTAEEIQDLTTIGIK